ncbi:MAG: hypothetical protein GX608_03125 [Lentisphaerae bacterium]|nr:hypothetical protein [Lentisphaerota bacterium]
MGPDMDLSMSSTFKTVIIAFSILAGAMSLPLPGGAAGPAVQNKDEKANMEKANLHGDGIHDDAAAIQALLDSGISCVALPAPAKNYAIGRSLRLRSGQTLRLEPTTVIRLLPGSSCAMLVNDPAETNAHDIRLAGGIWDMDNANQGANPFHPEYASDTKYPYRKYGGEGYSTERFEKRYHLDTFLGCAIQFYGIRRLEIRDVTVRNPVTYGIQVGGLAYFTIENIRFDYEGPRPHRINMDGVHLDGPCKFGVVRNLQGTTYDDLLALNADDMASGPIESVAVDGIFANDCLRAVRLLSAESRVSDITIANVFGTFYSNPFEFSQYYATPKRGDFGRIVIRNVFVSCGSHPEKPAWEGRPLFVMNDKIDIEYLAIDNFHRDEALRAVPCFRIGKSVHIRALALSNISLRNRTGNPITFLDHEGVIDRLVANNLDVTEPKPASGAGTVGAFITDGSCPGLKF